MAYDLDETLAVGDPLHVENHIAIAEAVNDLDTRVDAKFTTIQSIPTTPLTTDPDQMQFVVAGVVRAWLNEWRALRGRNPYTTWADALVRAIVDDGDNTSGDAIQVVDRRAGSPADVLFGVGWEGGVTQGDNPMGLVYVLESTENELDIPSTVPPGTLVVRKIA